MKIAVISDIHGNMAYLDRTKEVIDQKHIETVICCGDIGDEEAFLDLDSWKQDVYVAFGNADFAIKNKLDSGLLWSEKLKYFDDFGVVNLEKKKIAFTHYPLFAKKLAETGKYTIVFYGHNHKPWEEKIGQTVMLNPGEIQARDGRPTFAIYDLGKMKAELEILA
jgi:putative phosphoesterase